MAAGTVTPAVAAAGGSQEGSGGRADSLVPGAAGGVMVTRITGDRVLVGADGRPTGLLPAEGRESIPVQRLTLNGESHVIPGDARALIRAGTLEERLFDVTTLAGERYRRTGGLPLIVTYTGSAREQNTASARLADVAVGAAEGRTVLESINGEALTVTDEATAAIWAALTGATGEEAFSLAAAPGIATIALDGVAEKPLAESAAQIGAPRAWESGYDGEGVTRHPGHRCE